MIRKPIVTFMGHVDSGKTSLQDYIRQSTMTEREAGLITQHVGASSVPSETIDRISGPLLKAMKIDLTIPGLLFIDTPGHEAFTNLRKRGGNLADIAVLVVDINEGLKPQTIESLKILKQYKTPFVIAVNKIDLVHGFQDTKKPVSQLLEQQSDSYKQNFDTKFYNIVGQFYEQFQLNVERFDRVQDFTKQIVMVPCSAKVGTGMPELLTILTGLAQKFLGENLKYDADGPAKGTVLEVKEEKGIGKSLDVIIYDGHLKVNDPIVIGGIDQAIITKVRSLFEPKPLTEMRDKKSNFSSSKMVTAAVGVKISAPNIEEVVAGMPIRSCDPKRTQEVAAEIQAEVEEVLVETDKKGIIIKADTLGSLEALVKLLREKEIPIRSASVGNIQKKDIGDAESNYEGEPLHAVILGFNITDESKYVSKTVKVLTSPIIYKLIDDFEEWFDKEQKRLEAKGLDKVIRPAKVELLKGYVFRQNNPAIVGAEIIGGQITTGMPLMNAKGKVITEIKSIQHKKDNLSKADKGMQVALSLPGVSVGRQINEEDILYSAIPDTDFKKLKDLKKYLSPEETEICKEIAKIMREDNPVWGI